MIIIEKGNSASTFTTTFTEKLGQFNITGCTTFHFQIENDLTKNVTTFSSDDISINPWRYNQFIIDETQLNLVNGNYSYSASTSSTFDNILEVGKLLVTGSNSNNSIYW